MKINVTLFCYSALRGLGERNNTLAARTGRKKAKTEERQRRARSDADADADAVLFGSLT